MPWLAKEQSQGRSTFDKYKSTLCSRYRSKRWNILRSFVLPRLLLLEAHFYGKILIKDRIVRLTEGLMVLLRRFM